MSNKITKQQILNYLKTHKQEFIKKYNLEAIGLFGSYARGEADERSDIDIFVKMKPDIFKIVALKEQMERDLKKKVDILREHKNIKPFLLQMIKKDIEYV